MSKEIFKKEMLFNISQHYRVRYPDEFGLFAFESAQILYDTILAEYGEIFPDGVSELLKSLGKKYEVHYHAYSVAIDLLMLLGCARRVKVIKLNGKVVSGIQLIKPVIFDKKEYN